MKILDDMNNWNDDFEKAKGDAKEKALREREAK